MSKLIKALPIDTCYKCNRIPECIAFQKKGAIDTHVIPEDCPLDTILLDTIDEKLKETKELTDKLDEARKVDLNITKLSLKERLSFKYDRIDGDEPNREYRDKKRKIL